MELENEIDAFKNLQYARKLSDQTTVVCLADIRLCYKYYDDIHARGFGFILCVLYLTF